MQDAERAELHRAATISKAIVVIIFLIITSPLASLIGFDYLMISWDKVSLFALVVAFTVSRVFDVISTLIALNTKGGIELNPLSDSDNISKMIPQQLPLILFTAIFGYCLNIISSYIGNGYMIIQTMIGFIAGLSNLTTAPKFVYFFNLKEIKKDICNGMFIRAIIVCFIFFFIMKCINF